MFRCRFAFLFPVALILFQSCGTGGSSTHLPREGVWRVELDLHGHALPFQLQLFQNDPGQWVAEVHNASERITVPDVNLHNDSVFLRMPLFDSEFRGSVRNDSTIEGVWINYLKGPDYQIPFVAHAGLHHRFPGPSDGHAPVAGTWETHFSKGTIDAYNAIGLFEQHPEGRVSGTFVTETGDYRYLDGCVHGDSMKLSCFDGSHAFLFEAALVGDSLRGTFWSGTHWEEPWLAIRNPEYTLRNPDSLTFLREGQDMVDFNFPDLDGRSVSPHDLKYQGKVRLIQIMGSWCPNCVDETVLLGEVYKTYADSGLAVIAVAFEKHADKDRAVEGLKRFQRNLGVEYPIVHAGPTTKENLQRQLPFLDHMMSYPTCIFVDRNGTVRRIRTGFYGPSTGDHYENYRRNLHAYIKTLLAEPVAPKQLARVR